VLAEFEDGARASAWRARLLPNTMMVIRHLLTIPQHLVPSTQRVNATRIVYRHQTIS